MCEMTNPQRLARDLKQEARRLGLAACGIAKAERLDEQARLLEAWLTAGRHASMSYMDRNFEKRIDPTRLVDGAQSVVSVIDNYYHPDPAPVKDSLGCISRYARGDDYHYVLKDKLFALYHWLEDRVGTMTGRVFVDSAPVMDKEWARRSGLGWIGKHSNLINPSLGSYVFIGEMIISVPLAADNPFQTDHCGSCTACMDACPTDAIYRPYAVDANRCISYWTIEHRGDTIPETLGEKFGNWIFGCDICQEVCPWNKFSRPTREPRYQARPDATDTSLDTWMELDMEAFRARFRNSPVNRARFEGFVRNVRNARANRDRHSPDAAEGKE